ncbi:alpha/beta hydrolase [Actinomadura sp. NPDC048394]|jgi:pimeloyl-ACP methyl ester carboxylesterase|uniref:alpha/beta fold hydrolase n=1 Tax=Actinomadura sp. NPDC048394 TaxID=3158223 RepID=UPI0033C171DE
MTEFARTADLDIGYEVSGPEDGTPLVAVHGWPDDPHCWSGLLPAWHDARYRVYRPYLRGFGPTRFRSDQKMRSGQIGALGHDLACFLEALDLDQVLLVGHDWGARAGYVVGALFPQRVARLVAMSAGYATNRADAQLSWPLTHAYWYEWFVATERGRRAMHEDRRSFARYLWRSWSPGWEFQEAEFAQAADAWDNDDWPRITTHAYLHRWGEAQGDPVYDDIERRLLEPAPVQVPTLVLHGARDGDNLPETSDDKSALFNAEYERIVLPDVGHFPPRETPDQVADLISRHPGDG